jgi:serine/threonine-protein kinase
MSPHMPLAANSRLGPYEIVDLIGSGGMGEVYRAIDTRLGRFVAIKVLIPEVVNSEDTFARFTTEARAIAALSHPNILSIFEFDHDGERAFIVTELLIGEPLRERIASAAVPWTKTAEIGAAVCDGLAAAHAKQIIHRDLKPENIFLLADGQVKILDFGLAVIRAAASPGGNSDDTATNVLEHPPENVVGTIGYMSPEQLSGRALDSATDIFSLGCVLYEMVTGRRAFGRSSLIETMAAILNDDPPAVEQSGRHIPYDLQRVISRCLEKKPAERFQSARDLAFALRAIRSDSGSVAPTKTKPRGKSIAVIPFVNSARDPGADYLIDGITESVINRLARLPKLRVIARGTVFRYKGIDADPQTVGRELGVKTVLTGAIHQVRESLSIQAELVEVADNAQIWGERFNLRFSDIFAVQEEIAERIAEKLRVKLTGADRKKLRKRHTENPEAYQLFLRGRYQWNKRTADGFRRAIELFDQAIEHDPLYARAYVGLADCYNLLTTYSAIPPRDALPKAKLAATRALEIDESLAEAHASLAFTKCYFDWDWLGAETSFQRALELNPNYATAHHWYAWLLTCRRRFREAAAQMALARELDPLSLAINTESAWPLYYDRDFDGALSLLEKARQIDPDFIWVQFAIGQVLAARGDFDLALVQLERVAAIYPSSYVLAVLASVRGRAGRQADAVALIRALEERSKHEFVSVYDLALAWAGAGDPDAAFDYLLRAVEERSPWLIRIGIDPHFDSIRGDLRMRSIERRIGI